MAFVLLLFITHNNFHSIQMVLYLKKKKKNIDHTNTTTSRYIIKIKES